MLLAAAAAWAVSIVAATLLCPLAPVVEGPTPEIGTAGVASLAYVGPVATAFAYWAVVEVGRRVRASTISMALLSA
ncbi:MAG TPA: hypothetical protein VHR41_18800, partial [Gemmatimonadales bacterium]|nr:hypothetical protein [Gemmatimonadales bacterium]